ncbi:pickpocket protein 28-like [Aricia agestis]|uniref:pickpocket protein 28-like n=1 Tax=Aricia agestis TaxID=91739 RepID=UPI001C20563C|nr:pickpocket protein 28-like [Aricia agestis]
MKGRNKSKLNAPEYPIKKQNAWERNKQSKTAWYDWGSVRPTPNLGKSKEQRTPSPKLTLKSGLRDYLLSSTLHGLRYIGDKNLTWFERFFWMLSFGSSVVCAAFFILNVYDKWSRTPMIVTINPENMPLEKLPFPALTICNSNQARRSVAERYKSSGNTVDVKLLESLCSTRSDADLFADDDAADSVDWHYTRAFLINVTQPCIEMLALCIWDSEVRSCEDLFNAQLTDEGLCCTFNVVHREMMYRKPKTLNDMNFTFPSPAVDWTAEAGYPDDTPPNGFPWKARGIGTDHGLTLVLDADVDEYYCASTKSVGFKILLHNPTESPNIAKLGEIYGPGIESRVSIIPRILDAHPSLRAIDVRKRLCLFSGENDLDFYRTYTLRNCEMECEARAMLEVCKCVLYYMPKNTTTRVCNKADASCYSDLKRYSGSDRACMECLPACTEISYTESYSAAPLNKALVANYIKSFNFAQNITEDYFIKNMLVTHFFFEDNYFMRYTKGEIFGLTEFLSNTGGLLGLCMGFSVMSFVEVLYYLILRSLCVSCRKKSAYPFVK